MLVAGVFFIPVLWLCLIQSGNFLRNQTTMERYTKAPQQTNEYLKLRVINSGIKND